MAFNGNLIMLNQRGWKRHRERETLACAPFTFNGLDRVSEFYATHISVCSYPF
ncbi:hypothetical protein PGIGA_G00013690 [Pangasianodon gigas]|uniref:Uncharacterized protein n=1 Tax=Pangasianodon gigas TaxID=30993 RepID=A0ACC5WTA5_PANGG|nr:hypothetical protein [Pangasianodon gigas]